MAEIVRLVARGVHDKCIHNNPLEWYCHSCQAEAHFPHHGRDFDKMIGRFHRLLSEFRAAVQDPRLDAFDAQTLKHHAAGMVDAGNAALKALENRT
jgi:hypothetical protein